MFFFALAFGVFLYRHLLVWHAFDSASVCFLWIYKKVKIQLAFIHIVKDIKAPQTGRRSRFKSTTEIYYWSHFITQAFEF